MNECLADRVEDHVVRLAVLREVLSQVVDDDDRAERPHELDGLRAAHRSDVGSEVLGELHCCRANASRRAVDENTASIQRFCLPETGKRERCSVAHGRGLLEREAGRHEREDPALRDGDVLRVCSGPHAEDTVADGELTHVHPGLLDLTREFEAENPLLGPAQARHEATDEELGAPEPRVGSRDGGRVDLDQHLVVRRDGPLDLLEVQHLGRPVPVVNDRLISRRRVTSGGQDVPEQRDIAAPAVTAEPAVAELDASRSRWASTMRACETLIGQLAKCLVVHRATPFSVSTTFPVFCPVSTYLVASTTSSSGYVRSITAR